MRKFLASWIAGRSPRAVTLIAVAIAVAIGFIDLVSGYDLSLGLFYVVPIFLVSWYVSRIAGLLESLFCAGIWLFANYLSAPEHLPQVILLWNTAIRLGFFVVITVLLASLREAYSREKESARTDLLTGVANSRAIQESARLELMRAKRVGYPLTLLYLDLDNFKLINDTRGHAAGDALLVRIGNALKASVRATDLVGRVGGDEFVVLLPDTDDIHAGIVLSKIRHAIEKETRTLNEAVSVSIGAASADANCGTVDDLIRLADARMYDLKHRRKSRQAKAGESAKAGKLHSAGQSETPEPG